LQLWGFYRKAGADARETGQDSILHPRNFVGAKGEFKQATGGRGAQGQMNMDAVDFSSV
jgi:hypothetical protein